MSNEDKAKKIQSWIKKDVKYKKLTFKKLTFADQFKETDTGLQDIYKEYQTMTLKSYNRLVPKLNKELMRLISEMRTEPLYHDYYKAKEAVLSIMTVEIEHKGNKLVGYWRPKTLKEMGLIHEY